MAKPKQYVCNNARLMSEWDWSKNGTLGFDPHAMTSGTKIKVWWICSNGHTWDAAVSDRTRGRNCPYCSNKRVLVGINDLMTVRPDIAAEWHPTKNIPRLPTQFGAYSSKSAWWQCKFGHEWQASIGNRTRQKSGCPYCGNKKVLPGFNDLLTVNLELAEDWDYEENDFLPSEIIAGSHKAVAWKCKCCGHKWEAVVASRNAGAGCPRCGRESHSSFPEQAIAYYLGQVFRVEQNYRIGRGEVDVVLPEYNIAIEYDGEYYHSSQWSVERDAIKYTTVTNDGIILINVKESSENRIEGNIVYCIYDRSYSFIPTMIENLFHVIRLYVPSTPTVKVDFQTDYGAILAHYILRRKNNSLASKRPELVPYWDVDANGGLLPEQISYGSDRDYHWKCEQGHQWVERISNLVRGDRCPYCSGHRATETDNLSTKFPDIASEWHPVKNGILMPSDFTPFSDRSVHWICKVCGNEYEQKVNKRTLRGFGCPQCGRKKMVQTQMRDRIKKSGSLADNCPEIAQSWHPKKNGDITPSLVMKGSHSIVWWKCPYCNHEYEKEIRLKVRYPKCPKCHK